MGEIVKDRVVAALGEVWASIDDLLSDLDDADWATPTALPGWSVQDTVAHIVGTEAMLLGEPSPSVTIDRDRLTHVRNDIAEFNEVWIEHLRASGPAEVLAGFRERTAARLAALQALSDDEWTADSFTPSGPSTYGRFMQIRVFDCWLHEQDMRDALGRPGHESGVAVEVTLDELELAMGFIVGKQARAADGESIRFDLTDGGAVVRSISVVVDGRAQLVDEGPADPTVTVTMPIPVMMRRCAGRVGLDAVRDRIVVGGDSDLGERLLVALPYTI